MQPGGGGGKAGPPESPSQAAKWGPSSGSLAPQSLGQLGTARALGRPSKALSAGLSPGAVLEAGSGQDTQARGRRPGGFSQSTGQASSTGRSRTWSPPGWLRDLLEGQPDAF